MTDNSTFRQSHDAMRVSATRARGAPEELPRRTIREPIPGEREPDTLLGTQPGAVGGVGFGANLPDTDLEKTMDERTAHEHEVEGGGADSQRSSEHRKRT